MSNDTLTRKAVSRALELLRPPIEKSLFGLAEEVARVASEESARVVAAEAREAIDKARREGEEALEAARQEARIELEKARRDGEVQLANACADADRELTDVQSELTDRIAALEQKLRQVRADAETEARTSQFEAEKDHRDQMAAAIERARTDASQVGLAAAARLVESSRALDEAGSLGEVLHTLAECARLEAGRVAVLVMKNQKLQGWSLLGFDGVGEAPGKVVVNPADPGLLGQAVRSGAITASSSGEGQPVLALPPFAGSGAARHAVALPMLVGGSVVAVLYADAPRTNSPSVGSGWPALVEVLVRHASRILEAMMVAQSGGVKIPPRPGQATGQLVPGPVPEAEDRDEDAARRYARLLLSEVHLYNGAAVTAGHAAGDLLKRLRGEIARARSLYEARVPSNVKGRAEWFEDELVRTLAGGDASKLGAA